MAVLLIAAEMEVDVPSEFLEIWKPDVDVAVSAVRGIRGSFPFHFRGQTRARRSDRFPVLRPRHVLGRDVYARGRNLHRSVANESDAFFKRLFELRVDPVRMRAIRVERDRINTAAARLTTYLETRKARGTAGMGFLVKPNFFLAQ